MATTNAETQLSEEKKQTSSSEKSKDQEEATDRSWAEIPLLTIREVFVYRVPPLAAASGHRAEQWGLEKPVFTGLMKISRLDDRCLVRLYQPPKEGELGAQAVLFAVCPITLGNGRFLPHYCEHVMDSSRYFVLRCEDEKDASRVAYVGVGFRERSIAFDFKAALDDFVRSVDRQRHALQLQAEYEERVANGENNIENDESNIEKKLSSLVMPAQDWTLPPGAQIHIPVVCTGENEKHINNNEKIKAKRRVSGEPGSLPLLPPPPKGIISGTSSSTHMSTSTKVGEKEKSDIGNKTEDSIGTVVDSVEKSVQHLELEKNAGEETEQIDEWDDFQVA